MNDGLHHHAADSAIESTLGLLRRLVLAPSSSSRQPKRARPSFKATCYALLEGRTEIPTPWIPGPPRTVGAEAGLVDFRCSLVWLVPW